MQMEMSLAKAPNKVCVYKDFTCCLPHSLGCLLRIPACHDRHQIVFLLHTIQHTHASQMHMISPQIKGGPHSGGGGVECFMCALWCLWRFNTMQCRQGSAFRSRCFLAAI